MKDGLISAVWQPACEPLALSPRDWENLLGQARQTQLLGRLAQHLWAQGRWHDVPGPVRQYLEGMRRLLDRQHREVQWEVACIQRALRGFSGPVVLLKGAAYLMAGLPPAAGRIFSDIDILVAHEDLNTVESSLFRAGWIHEDMDAYKDRYYRTWMHEIAPLRHVQRGTVVDVHHTISPPTSRFRVAGRQLLERMVPVERLPGCYVLCPADMVLHSAVHLFQEGELNKGLRDLLDMHDLLLHFGRDAQFWPDLLTRAHALGLGEPLFHVLQHIERFFGPVCPVPLQHELARMAPAGPGRALTLALFKRALVPKHPSSELAFSGMAHWLLYVRSHYLRMPLNLVISHLARKALQRYFSSDQSASTANKVQRATP
jgi:hypothetical protein